MKKFLLSNLIAVIAMLAISSSAYAASYSEVHTFDIDEESREASFLFKRNGRMFSIVNAQNNNATEEPEEGDAAIKVLRATDNTLTDWEDVTDYTMFSTFAENTFRVDAIRVYRKHIYLAITNIEGEPELWRMRRHGKLINRTCHQVGADIFDNDAVKFGPMIKRRTTKRQKVWFRNHSERNALFINAETPDGNKMYRSTNGKDWHEVEVNDVYSSNSDSYIVSFDHHKNADTRYIYAVQQNGTVIRADHTNMTEWEAVLTIEPDAEDFDEENPLLTVYDAKKQAGKLYVVGSVSGDEDKLTVYVSEDWETTTLTDKTITNYPTTAKFRKIKSPGLLFLITEGEDGAAQLGVINKNGEFDEIAASDDGAVNYHDNAWFPSLIRFKGTRYFTYHDENTSILYQF